MAAWEKLAECFGSYYTVFIAIVAHVSIFLTCLTYTWPSPVLPKLFEAENNPLGRPITPEESDLIASICFVGAALGPLLAFGIVEKLGRRKVMIALSFIPAISYGVLTFADSITLYNVCRVLLGLWSGAVFSIEPVYVSEILADDERQFLMSTITIFGFSGVFAAVAVGTFLTVPVFNGLIAFVSFVLALIMTFGFPESPFDLMKNEGEKSVRELLQKLRKGNVDEEITAISETVASESKGSFLEFFGKLRNFKYLILATLPLLLQSYSGFPLILNYSQLIFMQTNVPISSEWCSIIVIGFTLSTTFLMFMNKKVSIYTLLTYCLFGLAICDLVLGFYFLWGKDYSSLNWLPLITLVIFVLVYNCALDSTPWMILGETYPSNISAIGSALSTSIFELSVFPSLFFFHKVELGYLYLFSAFCSVFGLIYVRCFVVKDVKKSQERHEMDVVA